MSGWEDFLGKVSSPGDLAVILISGPTAYLLDAGLNFLGFLEPGAVGINAAGLALGIKKLVESRQIQAKLKQSRIQQKERAEKLLLHFRESGQDDLIERVEKELNLLRFGISTLEEMQESLNKIVSDYREHKTGQALPELPSSEKSTKSN